jgi:hypothetical protein
MFIYIDRIITHSTAQNIHICSLNSAVRYCNFKCGIFQMRVYAIVIILKGKNVTNINKKAENLFAPSEGFGLVSRM